MEKHIITLEEYELMCEKLHSLENENSKLKGYIEGIEKQLSLGVVVGQSEQLLGFAKWLDEETVDGLLADPEYYVKRYLNQ